VFYAVLFAVQILLLSVRIGRTEGVWEIALSAMTAACWAVALVWFIILRARSRRYLDRP
jgi:threonine/homoserine/homoserine lactone efflux protein